MEKYKFVSRLVRLSLLLFLFSSLTACFDLPPIANAGKDQEVMVGDTVYLNTQKSWDINKNELSFIWSFYSKPDSSDATITDTESSEIEFIADVAGEYILQLDVNDGTFTTTDYVSIFVKTESELANTTTNSNTSGVTFEHDITDESCANCHDGIFATGMTFTHINSSDSCENCHTIKKWIQVLTVDHSQVIGTCIECHNNSTAIGKNIAHLRTTEKCDACHLPLLWMPAIAVDHLQVLGDCTACHNGSIALGLPENHLVTEENCGECHKTDTWKIQ